jgi:hypothetical protein
MALLALDNFSYHLVHVVRQDDNGDETDVAHIHGCNIIYLVTTLNDSLTSIHL